MGGPNLCLRFQCLGIALLVAAPNQVIAAPPVENPEEKPKKAEKERKKAEEQRKKRKIPGGEYERLMPGPWVSGLQRYDNGYRYCYDIERRARSISQHEMAWGVIFGFAALAAVAAGTILLTGNDTVTPRERIVGIAMPVLATGFTISSGLLLRRSSNASELSAAAARANTAETHKNAAARCREAAAAWNEGRSAAAAEADERFQQELEDERDPEGAKQKALDSKSLEILTEINLLDKDLVAFLMSVEQEGPLAPDVNDRLKIVDERLAKLKADIETLSPPVEISTMVEKLDEHLKAIKAAIDKKGAPDKKDPPEPE